MTKKELKKMTLTGKLIALDKANNELTHIDEIAEKKAKEIFNFDEINKNFADGLQKIFN